MPESGQYLFDVYHSVHLDVSVSLESNCSYFCKLRRKYCHPTFMQQTDESGSISRSLLIVIRTLRIELMHKITSRFNDCICD